MQPAPYSIGSGSSHAIKGFLLPIELYEGRGDLADALQGR